MRNVEEGRTRAAIIPSAYLVAIFSKYLNLYNKNKISYFIRHLWWVKNDFGVAMSFTTQLDRHKFSFTRDSQTAALFRVRYRNEFFALSVEQTNVVLVKNSYEFPRIPSGQRRWIFETFSLHNVSDQRVQPEKAQLKIIITRLACRKPTASFPLSEIIHSSWISSYSAPRGFEMGLVGCLPNEHMFSPYNTKFLITEMFKMLPWSLLFKISLYDQVAWQSIHSYSTTIVYIFH